MSALSKQTDNASRRHTREARRLLRANIRVGRRRRRRVRRLLECDDISLYANVPPHTTIVAPCPTQNNPTQLHSIFFFLFLIYNIDRYYTSFSLFSSTLTVAAPNLLPSFLLTLLYHPPLPRRYEFPLFL